MCSSVYRLFLSTKTSVRPVIGSVYKAHNINTVTNNLQMMPDNDKVPNVKTTDLAAKLALCMGLLSRPNASDLASLLSAFSRLEKSSHCLSEMMLPLEEIE